MVLVDDVVQPIAEQVWIVVGIWISRSHFLTRDRTECALFGADELSGGLTTPKIERISMNYTCYVMLWSSIDDIFHRYPIHTSFARINVDTNTCIRLHRLIHHCKFARFTSQCHQRFGYILSSEKRHNR